MAPASAPPVRASWRRSPLLAAILGWCVPGLGQLYAGRARKAALMLVAILPTFFLGWALSGFSVIDPDRYRLDFLAQMMIGGPTVAALRLVPEPVLDHLPRWLDVGRLYVQVAGLLNLVAIADAVGDVIAWNRRVLAWRAEEAERAARARAILEEAEPQPFPDVDADAPADAPADASRSAEDLQP